MPRKTPYKHRVRKHKRRTPSGKLITVSSYQRGKGLPKPHKTLHKRRSRKTPSHEFLVALNKQRTNKARGIDNKLHAPVVEKDEYQKWVHAPNEYDVTGVDTPGEEEKDVDKELEKYFKGLEEIAVKKQKDTVKPPYKAGDIFKVSGIALTVEDHGEAGLYVRPPNGSLDPIEKWLGGEEKLQYLEYMHQKKVNEIDKEIEAAKEEGNKGKVNVLKRSKEQLQKSFEKDTKGLKKQSNPVPAEATYNIATGWVQIKFDKKPSNLVLSQLKDKGFRYRPRSKIWKAKRTETREKLLKGIAGKVTDVNIDTDQAKKAKRYHKLAEKAREEREETWRKHDKIANMIPIGQPILAGHHSEGKHRKDINRMRKYANKNIELSEKIEKYERLEDKARGIQEHGENPKTVKNRIERLERQLKSLEGRKTPDAVKMRSRIEARLENEEKKYEKSGGLVADKVKLRKGMVIQTSVGKAEINKVSKKSLRINILSDARSMQGDYWRNYKIDKKDVQEVIKK